MLFILFTYNMIKRPRLAYVSASLHPDKYKSFKASIPESLVRQLQDIWKYSNITRREISGVVPITSMTSNTIRFGRVEPKRIGSRGEVSMNFFTGKREYNISFHTHPNPPGTRENVFTIPSIGDVELYMRLFPQTQVNLVLDGSGVFVVDYDPTKGGNVLSKYEKVFKTLENMQKISKESTNGKSPTDFLYWSDTKENIKRAMSTMRKFLQDVGLNIHYYFYDELGDIPFQFDDWTGENINKPVSPKNRNEPGTVRKLPPTNIMNINKPPINQKTFNNLLDKWERLFGKYTNNNKTKVVAFMKRRTNNKFNITSPVFAERIAINLSNS